MSMLIAAPRILDIGLAPTIDSWKLRRRMAASRRQAATAAPVHAGSDVMPEPGPALAHLRGLASRVRAPWLAKGWEAVRHAAKGGSRWQLGAATALTPFAVLLALPPVLAVARLPHVNTHYGKIIEDRAGIAVHMGLEPAGVVARPGSEPDVLVLPSGISASDPLYRMYDKVEGAGDRLTYYGWPLRSMLRAGLCHLGMPIEGTCGGASGGLQHAVRGLDGGFGGDGRIDRKVREFIDTPALSLLYGDDDARAALILDNVNFGYLPGGKPVIGITNASRVYFGEADPRKLSLARKAALVGLFKYPIPWDTGAGISEDGRESRNAVLRRARDVLVKTYGESKPEVIAALRELERPGFLPLRPAASLVEIGGAVRSMIYAELEDRTRDGAGGKVTAVELTVPHADGLAEYRHGFARALADMEKGPGFVRPLTGTADERADGLAVTTDGEGAILGLAATSDRIGLETAVRSGSHGKWVVLLALAQSGRFNANSTLCNRSADGIQNSGGDMGVADCSGGRGLIPIADVFAKSHNLPLIDAARQIDEAALLKAAAAAGFTLPGNGGGLSRSLILGSAQATPRTIIALGNALSNFANGGEAVGAFPHIIKRVRRDGAWSTVSGPQVLDLRSFLQGDRARRLIAAICLAPLANGTLAALGGSGEGRAIRCGKSATVATGRATGYQTISKAIVVSGPDTSWYTYLGAPEGVLGAKSASIIPLGLAVQKQSQR